MRERDRRRPLAACNRTDLGLELGLTPQAEKGVGADADHEHLVRRMQLCLPAEPCDVELVRAFEVSHGQGYQTESLIHGLIFSSPKAPVSSRFCRASG